MRAEYFFDTYALVAVLQGVEAYRPYAGEPVVCERYNLLELAAHLLKQDPSLERAKRDLASLRPFLLEPNRRQLLAAARFHAEHRGSRMSYVDAMGFVLASEHGMLFLTGDRAFEGLPGVAWVPVPGARAKARRSPAG